MTGVRIALILAFVVAVARWVSAVKQHLPNMKATDLAVAEFRQAVDLDLHSDKVRAASRDAWAALGRSNDTLGPVLVRAAVVAGVALAFSLTVVS